MLGGRGEGPVAAIHLKSWRALARLVTSGSVGWYKAWAQGEWTSPDPVALFDLFMRNAPALGDTGRAKGPWKLVNRLAHACAPTTSAAPGATSPIITIWGTISTPPGSIPA